MKEAEKKRVSEQIRNGDKMKVKKEFSVSFIYTCGGLSIFMLCVALLVGIAMLLSPFYGVDSPSIKDYFFFCTCVWILSFIGAALCSIGTGISFYEDKVVVRWNKYFKKEIAFSDIDYYRIDPIHVIVLIVKGKPLRLPLMLGHQVNEAEEYLNSIGIEQGDKSATTHKKQEDEESKKDEQNNK